MKELQENNYICYIDEQAFPTEKLYVEHFQKEHPDDFPFYCDQCEKGFKHEEDKNKHDNAKHNGNIKYSVYKKNYDMSNYSYYCKKCGESFACMVEWSKHVKIYNHYPYICKKCQKKFLKKHALDNHCKDKNH